MVKPYYHNGVAALAIKEGCPIKAKSESAKLQRAVGIAGLVVGLIYMGLTPYQVDPTPLGATAGFRFSGRTFPMLAGGGLTLAALVLLAGTRRTTKSDQAFAGDAESSSSHGLSASEMALGLAVTAIGLLYVWFMRYAGYWLATSVMVTATSLALGSKNHVATIAWSFAFTLAVTLVFSRIFYVPLPKGFLGL